MRFIADGQDPEMRVRVLLLVVVAVAAIVARFALLEVPFKYVPDVFYYDTQAAQALLAGTNPYGHAYAVPPGLETAGAGNVFAYLPGVLLFLSPFQLLADVRFGLIVCDVLVAIGFLTLKGREAGPTSAFFLALPPSILFSTWYPNNSLVGMAFLGLAIALDDKNKGDYSAALLGLALASNQFIWLLYPFFFVRAYWKRAWRNVLVTLVVGGAVVAPFALWNPGAFATDALFFEFGRPVQALVTPEPFGFNVNPTLSGIAGAIGISIPSALKVGIIAVLLGAALYKSRDLKGMLKNGSLFLLASIFVLPNDFSWWYLELPLQTMLAWFLLTRRV